MTGPSQFAIYPLPPDTRPGPGAIVTGPLSVVMERVLDGKARTDSLSLLDEAAEALGVLDSVREQELALHTRQVCAFCDSVARLSRRIDAVEARRRDEARAQAKAEAQAIRGYLDALPDPDNPEGHAHSPGGELHTVSPPQNRDPGATEGDAADADDQIPDPDDPSGVSLQMDQTTVATRRTGDSANLGKPDPTQRNRNPIGVSLHAK